MTSYPSLFRNRSAVPRYRALSFGQPLAPGEATYEFAVQSAVGTVNAHREPGNGLACPSPGIEIEQDDGEVAITPDLGTWAEALAVIREYRERSLDFVDERISRLAGDAARWARWHSVRSRIIQIMEAVAKEA